MLLAFQFAAFRLLVGFQLVLAQTGGLETKITGITDQLTTLGRPIAALALVLALISYMAEPALPEWARENKGVFRKVLFAAMFIGLVPDIINFFMA